MNVLSTVAMKIIINATQELCSRFVIPAVMAFIFVLITVVIWREMSWGLEKIVYLPCSGASALIFAGLFRRNLVETIDEMFWATKEFFRDGRKKKKADHLRDYKRAHELQAEYCKEEAFSGKALYHPEIKAMVVYRKGRDFVEVIKDGEELVLPVREDDPYRFYAWGYEA